MNTLTNLSTIEQGLLDLLDSQLDGLVSEYEEISQSYKLPTDEEDILKLIILVAERKLKGLEDIGKMEMPF